MEPSTVEEPGPQVVFRAGKKRKNYRQRPVDGETLEDQAAPTSESADQPRPALAANEEEEQSSVAEALRLRNARKSKLRGVGFRPEDGWSKPQSEDNSEQSLVLRNAPEDGLSPADVIAGMGRRFAPQTGLAGELVNKHMEEYIESELARRHRMEPSSSSSAAAAAQTPTPLPASATTSALGKPPGERPTMQGKLQEIDLGEEARARNIARTEQAHRRLQGDGSEQDMASPLAKERIGKDGKPWRPRKRRDSDDVKRDQMVEQFLHENRLDVYDVAPQAADASAADDETAADDRIAEEFRREFMEAMSERRRRRRAAAPASRRDNKASKKDDEVLRGPKLGGSRNDRAAIREILLRQQEHKKKAKR